MTIKNSITLNTVKQLKQTGEKITCLTAYDVSFARVLDNAGVEIVLVGDSLGMVIQGKTTTIPVTMDEMIYHGKCVANGLDHSMLMIDMPFMSYRNPDQALKNAGRLMKEAGAAIVKLEGGAAQAEVVKTLCDFGIPVCAHLGLQPQSVHKMGGYRVQGRDKASANILMQDAHILEDAGADMLVLECVPAALAKELTQSLSIAVIGIGAGVDTDGQVLVLQDVLGITPGKAPRFSKNFLHDAKDIDNAIVDYVSHIKSQKFPTKDHWF